jgi:hypothetical protein
MEEKEKNPESKVPEKSGEKQKNRVSEWTALFHPAFIRPHPGSVIGTTS